MEKRSKDVLEDLEKVRVKIVLASLQQAIIIVVGNSSQNSK